MKRFLVPLCAALLAVAPAEASITTTGAGKVPAGGGSSGYTGPGDVVSGAKAFWGLRAYSSAQADGTHKAINIVRTSDSQACDVLLNTSGGLGNVTSCSGAATGSVASFCASTTCTIVTWYEQVAGSANATQATVANQATLNLSCTGSLPCAAFNGTSNFYAITLTPTVQPLTVVATAERTSLLSGNSVVLGNASQSVFFRGTVANAVSGFFGSFMTNTAAADNATHAIAWVVNNAATSAISVDGAANTSAAPGSTAFPTSPNLGAAAAGSGWLSGNISEVALYASALSTTAGTGQTALIAHNQCTYYGFASC